MLKFVQHVRRFFVIGALVLQGCNPFAETQDLPPSRLRSLRQAQWQLGATDAPGEALSDVANVQPTIRPTPTPEPEYGGTMAAALERYRQTEYQVARRSVLENFGKEMTERDLADTFKAINSRKFPDSEVGMALLTAFFGHKAEWSKLEEAFRQLFAASDQARVDPEFILEHAFTLMKLGNFQRALLRVQEADQYFQALPKGQPTVFHEARAYECRAWSYEGLARETLRAGGEDDEVFRLQRQAIQSWEQHIERVQRIASTDSEWQGEREVAELHVQSLRDSMAAVFRRHPTEDAL